MREILFRGKVVDSGEWVYGDLLQSDYSDGRRYRSIMGDDTNGGNTAGINRQVSPDTVGQYTELTDKNGVRIFEGDIVSFSAEEYFKSDGRLVAVDRHGEIVFCEGAFMILSENSYFALSKSAVKAYDLTVCGNIHDNPELLLA